MSRKKIFALGTAGILFCSLLAVYLLNRTKINTSKELKTLVWNIGTDQYSYDPQLSNSLNSSRIIEHTFEGLYRLRKNGPEAYLAESCIISDDKKTYTFKIRDAKWSDGKPCTAHDFEFAWKRGVDKKTASGNALLLSVVKNAKAIIDGKIKSDNLGVKALDDKTLQVELEYPCEYLLSLTTTDIFMPTRKDIVENSGSWSRTPGIAVGNGPYVITESILNKKLVLEKNPYYYNKDNVKIDKIVVKMINDDTNAYNELKLGNIDVICRANHNIIDDCKNKGICHIIPRADTSLCMFNFNNPALKDKLVRQSLFLAIDREAIIKNLLKDNGEIPAIGLIPCSIKDSEGREIREVAGNYGIALNDSNVKKAKELLATAGYPNGNGLPTIELLISPNKLNFIISDYLQKCWKQNLGINIKVNTMAWPDFSASCETGNFGGICKICTVLSFPDSFCALRLFQSNSINVNGYNNKKYDSLIDKIRLNTGKERDEAIYTAEKMLIDDAACIPLYHGTNQLIIRNNVKGWIANHSGCLYFGDADIT